MAAIGVVVFRYSDFTLNCFGDYSEIDETQVEALGAENRKRELIAEKVRKL